MKRIALALSAFFAVSAASHAADLSWNTPAPASPIYSATSVANWSGFYAGINGGYSWGTTTTSPGLPGQATENNSGGWALGGQAGYNMDMGGFVVGAEADLQWTNLAFSAPVGAAGTFDSGVDLLGTARVRVGVPVGQVMPYATLGAAYGRGTAKVTDANNVVTSQTAGHLGWTAGVGLEAQATQNISFKAEYLYVDLGTQAYNGLPTGNLDVTQRFSTVRAGINYKF